MALFLFLNLLITQQSNVFRDDNILNRDPTRVRVCVCLCVCAIYFNKGIFKTLPTSKMELSTKTGNSLKELTVFAKSPILDS